MTPTPYLRFVERPYTIQTGLEGIVQNATRMILQQWWANNHAVRWLSPCHPWGEWRDVKVEIG